MKTLSLKPPPSSPPLPLPLPLPLPMDSNKELLPLIPISNLAIRAIHFHVAMLVSSITIPIWLLYYSLLLLTDPIHTLKRGFDRLNQNWPKRLQNHGGLMDLAACLARGLFWASVVLFLLSALLLIGFVTGALVMRRIAQEPVRLDHGLSFDYTKPSPVAFVPVQSGEGARRFLGLGQELALTVRLTLPESDHNLKLGMFQVKAEILTDEGKITASSIHPSILRFKSPPVRIMETLAKAGPLLAGYSSESQTLTIRTTSLVEGVEPTACIRVVLQHRAEFKDGEGIPEIYSASIRLESKLSLLKRIIWNWRMTAFIWISMGIFILELIVFLACFRTILLPKRRAKSVF